MYLGEATAASATCTTHRSRIQYHMNATIACVALSTLPLWQVCSCRKGRVCAYVSGTRERAGDDSWIWSIYCVICQNSNVIVARTGWTHLHWTSILRPILINMINTNVWRYSSKKEGGIERKKKKERDTKDMYQEIERRKRKERKKDCIWSCYFLHEYSWSEMWGLEPSRLTGCWLPTATHGRIIAQSPTCILKSIFCTLWRWAESRATGGISRMARTCQLRQDSSCHK